MTHIPSADNERFLAQLNADLDAFIERMRGRTPRVSKTSIARSLNCDRTTLYKWLDGTNRMPLETLKNLCRLMDFGKQEQNKLLILGGYVIGLVPDATDTFQVTTTKIANRKDSIQLHTFLSPTAFFARYMEPHRLFHHRLPQVGRRVQMRDLLNFVEGNRQIAILSGRGGSGKSKLLHTLCRRLARRYPDLAVYLAAENISITETALNELPADNCLVIVDDAHRVAGIEVLLGTARQNPAFKILLVTRPYATDYLNMQVRQTGFDVNDMTVNSLPDLDYKCEHRRLARLALGYEWAHYADELASVTRDSPFLTVLGGQMLRVEKVAPSLLAQNIKFRHEVLSRFYDIHFNEIISKLSTRFTEQLCIDILPVIAVMTPFDIQNRDLLQAVAHLLKTDEVKIKQLIDAFVKAGALAQGGRLVRIIPDVLSDFILHEECFTSDGVPTGWATTVYQAVADFRLDVVLRNLAEVDWRVRTTPSSIQDRSLINIASVETGLLESIWRDIVERFRASSLAERKAWLNRLERIAFMQPGYLWVLVQIAQNEPKSVDADEVSPALKPWLRPTTQEDILSALGPILRGIACDDRFTARCAELLWEMGRNAEMKKGYSSSAMDILCQLASYEYYKPHTFSHIVLNCCREWIDDPNIHIYHHSILEVLSPMLARQTRGGINRRWFSDGSFTLPLDSLHELRRGALAIVERCALSRVRRIVLEALRTLHTPVSEEGLWELREAEPENWHMWEEEQLASLKIVSQIAQSNEDPFVRLRIWETIHWQAVYGPRPTVQAMARKILESLPHSFASRCILLMTNKHGRGYKCYHRTWEDIEETDEAWLKADSSIRASIEQDRQFRAEKFARQVTHEWVERYPDPCEGFNVFNEWIQCIEMSGWWNEFWTRNNPFVFQLTTDFPDYVHTWCEIALENPEARAVQMCDDMLCELRRLNATETLKLVQRFLATDHSHLWLRVAASYSWRGWPSDPLPEEWQIVSNLLIFPDPQVKRCAADIVSAIAMIELQRAIELVLETNVGEDSELAEKLFGIFEEQRGFDITGITFDQLERLLEKLQKIESINHYHVGRFLLQAALFNPVPVAQLLLERVRHKAKLSEEHLERHVEHDNTLIKQLMDDFEGLPGSGFHDNKFQEVAFHPDYIDALRLIRDAALSDEYQSALLWEDTLSELFRTYSLNYCSTSLDVLNEWINSGDCTKTRATIYLLGDTYLSFYTNNLVFLSNYLHRAQECGRTTLEEVERAMLQFAEFGPPRAMASHRGERSNRLLHGAIEALGKVQGDTLTSRFFQQLRNKAQEMILSEMQQEGEEEMHYRS